LVEVFLDYFQRNYSKKLIVSKGLILIGIWAYFWGGLERALLNVLFRSIQPIQPIQPIQHENLKRGNSSVMNVSSRQSYHVGVMETNLTGKSEVGKSECKPQELVQGLVESLVEVGDKRWVWDDGGRSSYHRARAERAGDCCVRSVAIASGVSYERVMEMARLFKEKGHPSNGMYDHEWELLMKHFCDVDYHRSVQFTGCMGRSLKDVLPKLRGRGYRFIVELEWGGGRRRNGHLTCVSGGKLRDTWDCREMIVKNIFPVVPKKRNMK